MEKELKVISQYEEFYHFIKEQPRTKDECLSFAMEELKLPKTSSYDTVNPIFAGNVPALIVIDGKASIDHMRCREIYERMGQMFGEDVYKVFSGPPPASKGKSVESNIPSIESVESPVVQDYQKQLNDKKAEIRKLNKQIKEIGTLHQAQLDVQKQTHEQEMEELRNQHEQEMSLLRKSFSEELEGVTLAIVDETCEGIISEMEKKMFVTQSIRSKPKEKLMVDVFLDDPARTLDIPMLVSKRGGETDSIYEVIDESEKRLDPEDHIDRVSRGLFKMDIFKRRVEDESKLRLVKAGTKREQQDNCRQITDTDIYANRLQTINNILTTDDLSNQQKLALYAAWSEYKGSDFAENLALAGEKGLDAGHVIRLLERPMEHDNYHNIRAFLLQALKSSEAKLKREAVKELICGEWIVEAEYGGKICRFQMVPVDEIVAFKEALEKLKINEAIRRANNIIAVERIASFEDDDPRKKMYVERKKSLQERTEEMSGWLRQQEEASGVDVHEAVSEEMEDDFEDKGEVHGAGKE